MSLIDRLFRRPPEPDDQPVQHEIEVLNGSHAPALRRAQRAIRTASKVLDEYATAEAGRRGKH